MAPGFEISLLSKNVDHAYQEAIAQGAQAIMQPTMKPWGQKTSYVRDLNGILVAICSPME